MSLVQVFLLDLNPLYRAFIVELMTQKISHVFYKLMKVFYVSSGL